MPTSEPDPKAVILATKAIFDALDGFDATFAVGLLEDIMGELICDASEEDADEQADRAEAFGTLCTICDEAFDADGTICPACQDSDAWRDGTCGALPLQDEHAACAACGDRDDSVPPGGRCALCVATHRPAL